MWLELAWGLPDFDESVWQGVPVAVDEMRQTKLILANKIRSNVFGELERVIDSIRELNGDMELAWHKSGVFRGREFRTDPVPGYEYWSELLVLSNQALDDSATLQSWHNFGASVGRCRWEEWSRRLEDDWFPDWTGIVNAAVAIPVSERTGVPIVDSIAREAEEFRRDRGRLFLRKLIERDPAIWPFEKPPSQKDEPASGQIASLLISIDNQVQQRLRLVPARAPDRPRRSQRPEWHREAGELRIGDVVVRHVRTVVAKNIVRLLVAFQEDQWASRVDSPFPPRDDKLGEAVKSLNKGLKLIRFGLDGTGEGVEWAWNDAAP